MGYRRAQTEKEHLKKLYEETKHSYGCGAWYSERKGRYIRYSCHDKWFRNYCRRVTRRRIKRLDLDENPDKIYKKIFDYWWTIL